MILYVIMRLTLFEHRASFPVYRTTRNVKRVHYLPRALVRNWRTFWKFERTKNLPDTHRRETIKERRKNKASESVVREVIRGVTRRKCSSLSLSVFLNLPPLFYCFVVEILESATVARRPPISFFFSLFFPTFF